MRPDLWPKCKNWLLLAALAGVYFCAGKLGLNVATENRSITLVWAPSGISLAAMLLLGYRVWPGIFAGALLVNVSTTGQIFSSLGIATGNTLEAAIGASLVNYFANGRNSFERPQDIMRFAIYAAMFSTMAGATIGVTSLCLSNSATWHNFPVTWLTWWLGDATGDLAVAPVILLWWDKRPRYSARQLIEGALILGTLYFICMIVFGDNFSGDFQQNGLSYLPVPVLVWTAFSFSQRETALIIMVLEGLAIYGTIHDRGPFALPNHQDALFMLDGFLGVNSVLAMMFSAIIADRRKATTALKERTAQLATINERLAMEATERKRAQEAIAEHAKELARSNAELEQFAYIASHDLQEPLRMVVSYMQLLSRKYKGKLDGSADKYIHYAEDGALRMQEMIRDLLSFSRIGRESKPFEEVNCNEVVSMTLTHLRPAMEEAGAEVTVDELPLVKADATQLGQVFQNLIGNAIKFKNSSPPKIHIGAKAQDDQWNISVEDNGIGIDKSCQERIFQLFQRLNDREKYPGSGIGLAIAKKIIEHHGGRIWVESEKDHGTVFHFTLPKA